MDPSSNQPPERLEDQLRRMILTNGTTQPNHDTGNPQTPPTVRLPSEVRHQALQQSHNGPVQNQLPSPQRQQFNNQLPPRGALNQHRNYNGTGYRGGRGQRNVYRNGSMPSHGSRKLQHSTHDGSNGTNFVPPHQRARYQQQMQLDPDAFQRRAYGQPQGRQNPCPQQLFNPNAPQAPPQFAPQSDQYIRQAQYLDQVAAIEISSFEMSAAERNEKELFRLALQQVVDEVCATDPERLPKISVECFGSFRSGFATAGSDMDLVIVVKDNISTSAPFSLLEDDLPRLLEKRLLQLEYGARLLSRTRVPIIKVCQKPDASFLDKLREEREKWDDLPNEKKYPHLHPEENEVGAVDVDQDKDGVAAVVADEMRGRVAAIEVDPDGIAATKEHVTNGAIAADAAEHTASGLKTEGVVTQPPESANGRQQKPKRENSPPWTRERKAGPLDFPKTGVGIQSDINFFNPLGIHNTHLLQCYSFCDPRVKPMVLFIKAWAKRRKINSSYSGTLSSYGYVLMVLHYLVNVARPPMLPNLQSAWRPSGMKTRSPTAVETVDGWGVQFWRHEDEIASAAQHGLLTANREPLGSLLAGFFTYYASLGGGYSFTWTQEVLSLRSNGGLLTKEEKGWTKAVTEESEGRRIQHRYLFCIEDPFELSHNVARTVTHKGIVAIRDEFRRARRILQDVGRGLFPKEGDLFAQLVEPESPRKLPDDLTKHDAQTKSTDVITNGTTSPNPPRNDGANQKGFNQNRQMNQNNRNGRGPNQRGGITQGQGRNGTPKKGVTSPKKKQLDMNDNEAFPSLGGTKPRKKRSEAPAQPAVEEYREISGDKAKRYLEEVKMKKHDAQMESTATDAALAVLGDSD